jgi:hypothetical protein
MDSKQKPWMKYAGMVESGDPNSSLNIDAVVYGSTETSQVPSDANACTGQAGESSAD